jgi:DNA polymerase
MPTNEEYRAQWERYGDYYRKQREETGIPSLFEVFWMGHLHALATMQGQQLDSKLTDWIKDPAMYRYFAPEVQSRKIDEAISVCHNCELAKHRTNTVPGTGPVRAQLMFVGEAPGKDEDATGNTFCGLAGTHLDEYYLAKCYGMSRDDVRVVNILKCRPPGNRNPAPIEVQACQHFLVRQILVTNPKVIVALGKQAGSWLLGQEVQNFKQVHGQLKWWHHIPFYITPHPAAFARDQNKWRGMIWETSQWVKWILAQGPESDFWGK